MTNQYKVITDGVYFGNLRNEADEGAHGVPVLSIDDENVRGNFGPRDLVGGVRAGDIVE
ncbi:MAG: hypothetical protein U5N86_11045 [Planctomycetota bacterium]|nr:hypothetical protein [Planctomycetota bacterium]